MVPVLLTDRVKVPVFPTLRSRGSRAYSCSVTVKSAFAVGAVVRAVAGGAVWAVAGGGAAFVVVELACLRLSPQPATRRPSAAAATVASRSGRCARTGVT